MMNGHMDRRPSLSEEELSLFDEKTLSDLENDLRDAETERRFPSWQWTDTIKPHIRTFRASSWRAILCRSTFALLPSFIQNRFRTEHKPDKLFPTSYLDGMRGLAALFVFFCHYSYSCFVITEGYGHGGPGENNNILQLPFIRLFYSGPPMVCLFFVISGYALSLKPLKQMRSHQWDALNTTLTSSIFRRGIRLFLPTTISTFMVVLLLRMGFYESTRAFASNKQLLRNIVEYHPERLPTFTAQFNDWIWRVYEFVHVWGWESFGGSTGYDVHLWTIPVEFRCSMVLFLVLSGLARLRVWIRLTSLFFIAWFTYRNGRWEMLLFLAGMFLAELDLIRLASRRPTLTNTPLHSSCSNCKESNSQRKKIMKGFWIALGIVALYLMSQPDDHFSSTPGWITLSTLIPTFFTDKYRYYQCLGSILLVLATNHSKFLQKPFNHPIIQYLGKISYALYLVHGPVLHVIGYRIEPWAWGVTGSESRGEYVRGFLLGAVFIVPTTVWVADLFWRWVDGPTVRFARWVEGRCNVPAE
ncbi:acyltransferase [Tothia fuscella]|uniref:Acyltransferase n=1 Tax=Tothia fuscella TaxID=1048955 RepID=A0A9P4NUT6_9PEZI|nr:acyltransferase [Tothia fuscella]